MHVAPVDLRAVRQDGIDVRFAMLGEMAFILAELPETGSAGTSMEAACVRPHWGFVIEGALTFVSGRRRLAIPKGNAFHVPPDGPEHRFRSAGPALIAGFEPVGTDVDLSDDRLVELGFELVTSDPPATIVPPVPARRIAPGEVRSAAWQMSDHVLTRVRMGERSGYTAGWCDAPHWGLVTGGRLAIEWEDDIEILSKGDVYWCPAGPPGHRIEAAASATMVDLTPLAAMRDGRRLADWRTGGQAAPDQSTGIAVAALG